MNKFTPEDEVCARCGAEKKHAKHTRLYGLMCACGSQEWIKESDIFTVPDQNIVMFTDKPPRKKVTNRP